MALDRGMKRKTSKKKQHLVSQIVHTVDKDGRNMLGFTVFFSDGRFYNVMRSYTVSDYAKVLAELTAERQISLDSTDTPKDSR